MTADRDDLSWWDELISPLREYESPISAYEHVRALFPQSAFGSASEVPDLRTLSRDHLSAAGLSGETPAATTLPPSASGDITGLERQRPPSWKLPSRGLPRTILGDDTAAGPARAAPPAMALIAPGGAALDTPPIDRRIDAVPSAADAAAPPRDPAAPVTTSPLDHPQAQSGLALMAADSLLRKGIDLAVGLANGDPALARKLIEMGANALAGALPEPYRASAAISADAAAAEAERRIGENDRAVRTRAALGTLANRRTEAEHDHAAAVVAGDHTKIADARREAIDAWRAERRARGDGEAEINAGARALETQYRRIAIRHRFAQMDDAGITRALVTDEEVKADPAAAREIAAEIKRLRREDPARAGEATIERAIAEKKRDGRIATNEDETRERHRLRLEAQAQRGIPEDQRRLLTSAERTAIALEYHRIESAQGKAAADVWLEGKAQEAGANAARFNAEIVAPVTLDTETTRDAPARERTTGGETPPRIYPAQAAPETAKPPSQDDRQPPADPSAGLDALRRKVDADADKLERDYDPSQKPGHPSRIKRAFALLKSVDDPAFDDLARELHYDPARLRAIARLLTAKPGDYDALRDGLRDENGPITDSAFFALYNGHLRSLIGTGTSPSSKAMPSADRRISVVLDMLGHDLSSWARGDLARNFGVNSEPINQIAQSALEDLGLSAALASLSVRGVGKRSSQRRAAIGERTNSQDKSKSQKDDPGKIRENNRIGLEVQKFVVDRLRRDFESLGLIVTNVRQIHTPAGRTDPDSTIRTNHDQILLAAEVKAPDARFRNPQRRKQEMLPNMYLFRANPSTGNIEVFRVPSTSYRKGKGIDYEMWRRDFVQQLRTRGVLK